MNSSEKLCDHCGKRPATHHTCSANEGRSTHLCAECFESITPPEIVAEIRNAQVSFREGKCRFCGAPARLLSSAGNLTHWLGEDHDQTLAICERCVGDAKEFWKRPENRPRPEALRDDPIAALQQRFDQLDDYMREKVQGRNQQ